MARGRAGFSGGRHQRRWRMLRHTVGVSDAMPMGLGAYTGRMRWHRVEEYRAMGEPGILALGLTAGYTVAEIAADRGWSDAECAEHLAALKAYGAERQRRRDL